MSEHGPERSLVVRDETLDPLIYNLEPSLSFPSAPSLIEGPIPRRLMQEDDIIEFDYVPREVFLDDDFGPLEELGRKRRSWKAELVRMYGPDSPLSYSISEIPQMWFLSRNI